MQTCSQEVIILDLHTSDQGSSPVLAIIYYIIFFLFVFVVFVVIFGVEKTCFIIIRALLSAFLHVSRLA